MIRRYSELINLSSFKERFEYLKIGGVVGETTFGFDRYLNQLFYKSDEWKDLRRKVIIRDLGHDLGLPDDDYLIVGSIYVHHMNPIRLEDISKGRSDILNPEYLVCTSFNTHQAIHYGDETLLPSFDIVERKPGDTCLWR